MFMRGQTLEQLLVESAAAARPPVRMTVSQAAEKFRKLNNPGSYVGPLLNDRTPYLVVEHTINGRVQFGIQRLPIPNQSR